MSNKKGNLIFIGLASSGKSSFIAALWHVVDTKEIDKSIVVSSLPSQRQYLNFLRTEWLDCKSFDRTKSSDFKDEITLHVSTSEGKQIDLLFPDVDGEIYQSLFEQRSMPNDLMEKIKSTSDILLFINPDRVSKPDLISSVHGLVDLDQDMADGVSDETDSSTNHSVDSDEEIEWDPRMSPTQVVLVDILQTALKTISFPKISIVVSAWDSILELPEPNRKLPAEWLKSELPLLNQFLESNSDEFRYEIFGVSAQGGNYKKDKLALQKEEKPSKRIKVQTKSAKIFHDITLPLKWILND